MPWTKTSEQQAAALADTVASPTAILERRKAMLERATAWQPPGGLVRATVRRGDYRVRRR